MSRPPLVVVSMVGLLDQEDGIPSTAVRLLAHPMTGDVFVGSSEGLIVVSSGK
jgi:hypothetical protein